MLGLRRARPAALGDLDAIKDHEQVAAVTVAVRGDRVRAAAGDLPGAGRGRGDLTLGWDSLTETERSIADLVAEGHTNREVAAAMFLSPHTVGYHLRHIFSKVGVDSRVELTRLLVQLGQQPA